MTLLFKKSEGLFARKLVARSPATMALKADRFGPETLIGLRRNP
jgi:hypothetical protein